MDGLPIYENDDEDDDDDDDNNDMFHLDAPSSRTSDESRYPVPFLCDERLRDLKISYWTDVSVTDDYAARVISLYLVTDHPLLGVFDPHLFISDLVGQRQTYCSRLLVNALMYWGCVSLDFDNNPHPLKSIRASWLTLKYLLANVHCYRPRRCSSCRIIL